MKQKEMEDRMEELETQAKDEYIKYTEWTYILEMLNDEEYAELKSLYKAMDISIHTIMDDRGQNE